MNKQTTLVLLSLVLGTFTFSAKADLPAGSDAHSEGVEYTPLTQPERAELLAFVRRSKDRLKAALDEGGRMTFADAQKVYYEVITDVVRDSFTKQRADELVMRMVLNQALKATRGMEKISGVTEGFPGALDGTSNPDVITLILKDSIDLALRSAVEEEKILEGNGQELTRSKYTGVAAERLTMAKRWLASVVNPYFQRQFLYDTLKSWKIMAGKSDGFARSAYSAELLDLDKVLSGSMPPLGALRSRLVRLEGKVVQAEASILADLKGKQEKKKRENEQAEIERLPKWTPLPVGVPFLSITVNQGVLFAVGVDENLYRYVPSKKAWTAIGVVGDITLLRSKKGTIYGVSKGREVFATTGFNPWVKVGKCCVTDVAIANDGTLFGIGGGPVWLSKPAAHGAWSQITEGVVTAIVTSPSGSKVFGLGVDNNIYTFQVEGNDAKAWEPAGVHGVSQVSTSESGKLYFVGTNGSVSSSFPGQAVVRESGGTVVSIAVGDDGTVFGLDPQKNVWVLGPKVLN